MSAEPADLLARWTALLGPDAEPVGRDLLARWSEPHRGYHDRRHLAEVLDALDVLTAGRPPLAVVLAAWFHDAVYEGRAGDDERASAGLAAAALPALVDPGTAAEVVRLVLLTATHRPGPGDQAGALLCDADLSVLAAPAERYDAYVRGVRQEHAHVDDASFRAGRARVLRALLDGPLFRTPAGAARWEARARAQVGAELERLSAPDGGAAPRP